jgi:endonuclease III
MPKESQKAKVARASKVLDGLHQSYPNAKTALQYTNAFELLIATILSAQATDVSVNAATPKLFEQYPTPQDMARASPEELEPYIRNIGLHRPKARNLAATARMLVEVFNAQVPNDYDAIQTLPGVGPKTATVVLSNIFGRPGIAVDTHVGRLARRLGFSSETNPDKVEVDLEKLFATDEWIFVHNSLIFHGRQVCHARNPNCSGCALLELCPQIGV